MSHKTYSAWWVCHYIYLPTPSLYQRRSAQRYHRAQSGAACIQFDFCHRRNDRSRLRYQICRRENKGDTSSESYFFHALLWCIIISVIFILIGIFIPDRLVGLLGGDSAIINTGQKTIHVVFMHFYTGFSCATMCATLS